MSSHKAWKRLCCKQTPSKKVYLSPIKPISYHLCSTSEFKNDSYASSCMWTLLNTEEFFYQNAGSLVHFYFEDAEILKAVLRDSMHVVYWNRRLINHSYLGKGSFGKVFKAEDKVTGEVVALKSIIPPGENNLKKLLRFLGYLLIEQNNMSELNKSPFFVRMLSAFQDIYTTEFWFVLEYCICDLTKLINVYPDANNFRRLANDYKSEKLLKKVSEKMDKVLKLEYFPLVFMYLFEMLCALHYLASRHVIHADIKPDNILISRVGHIKMADFGMSFRNQWFDRSGMNSVPFNENEVQKVDKLLVKRNFGGTLPYLDPELHIRLKLNDDFWNKELIAHFQDNVFYNKVGNTPQNFSSDLYAVGLTMFQLLLGGFLPSKKPFLWYYGSFFWEIDMIFNSHFRGKALVRPMLKMSTDNDIFSIVTFLLSVFQPRQIRAENFLSEILLFQNNKVEVEKFIDIAKVENIFYYKSKSITKESVGNIEVSKYLLEVLTKSTKSSNSMNDEKVAKEQKYQKIAFRLHTFEYSYPRSV